MYSANIDLLWKSVDWFLYDNGLRHERVKEADKLLVRILLVANKINSMEKVIRTGIRFFISSEAI